MLLDWRSIQSIDQYCSLLWNGRVLLQFVEGEGKRSWAFAYIAKIITIDWKCLCFNWNIDDLQQFESLCIVKSLRSNWFFDRYCWLFWNRRILGSRGKVEQGIRFVCKLSSRLIEKCHCFNFINEDLWQDELVCILKNLRSSWWIDRYCFLLLKRRLKTVKVDGKKSNAFA